MAQHALTNHHRRRGQIGSILKHVVINFFVLIILLPLAWVLLLSIKSIPDAYTGALWPETFDFTHYGYVLQKIDTLPRNLWNSIYVTMSTVLDHLDLRRVGRLCPGPFGTARAQTGAFWADRLALLPRARGFADLNF